MRRLLLSASVLVSCSLLGCVPLEPPESSRASEAAPPELAATVSSALACTMIDQQDPVCGAGQCCFDTLIDPSLGIYGLRCGDDTHCGPGTLEIGCGPHTTGCHGVINCGGCPTGQHCAVGFDNGDGTDDGDPVPGGIYTKCCSTFHSCAQQGLNCGWATDGCTVAALDNPFPDQIFCGTCPAGQTCYQNICCIASTTCNPGQCNSVPDGCGSFHECPACPNGLPCNQGVCCAPTVTACPANFECGFLPNGCGQRVTCGGGDGTCPPGQGCVNHACSTLPACSPTQCGDIPVAGGTIHCGACPSGMHCTATSICVSGPPVPSVPALGGPWAGLGLGLPLVGLGAVLVRRRRRRLGQLVLLLGALGIARGAFASGDYRLCCDLDAQPDGACVASSASSCPPAKGFGVSAWNLPAACPTDDEPVRVVEGGESRMVETRTASAGEPCVTETFSSEGEPSPYFPDSLGNEFSADLPAVLSVAAPPPAPWRGICLFRAQWIDFVPGVKTIDQDAVPDPVACVQLTVAHETQVQAIDYQIPAGPWDAYAECYGDASCTESFTRGATWHKPTSPDAKDGWLEIFQDPDPTVRVLPNGSCCAPLAELRNGLVGMGQEVPVTRLPEGQALELAPAPPATMPVVADMTGGGCSVGGTGGVSFGAVLVFLALSFATRRRRG